MQILYGSIPLTGVAQYELPDNLRIVPNYEVQEVKALGAAGITQIDRGNDSHVLTWGIWRLWLDGSNNPDREAAYAFLVSHEIELRKAGVVTLTYQTTAGTFYYVAALAKISEAYTLGCSTYHKYTIKTGLVTQAAPPGAGG